MVDWLKVRVFNCFRSCSNHYEFIVKLVVIIELFIVNVIMDVFNVIVKLREVFTVIVKLREVFTVIVKLREVFIVSLNMEEFIVFVIVIILID